MRRMITPEGLPRFLSEKIKEDWAKCWIWQGDRDADGRAVIAIDGKVCKVAELVYELKHGPLPKGFEFVQDCGKDSCVNPDHLFLVPFLAEEERVERRRPYQVVECPDIPSARSVTHEGEYGDCVRFLADCYSNDEILELGVKIEKV